MPRSLVIILGDQLDRASAAFDGFDRTRDRVWMAEVAEESTHVWTHKARIAVFLAAMRHFRDRLVEEGLSVDYTELAAAARKNEPATLAAALAASLRRLAKAGWQPERLVVVEPGEWRVQEALRAAATEAGIPLEIRTDRHFFSTRDEFAAHARGRKQLRLEYFYRPLREKFGVLMDDGEPAGGQWNFDAENRGAFGKAGPGVLPAPVVFPPDAVTRGVIDLVNVRFADHPGSLAAFDIGSGHRCPHRLAAEQSADGAGKGGARARPRSTPGGRDADQVPGTGRQRQPRRRAGDPQSGTDHLSELPLRPS